MGQYLMKTSLLVRGPDEVKNASFKEHLANVAKSAVIIIISARERKVKGCFVLQKASCKVAPCTPCSVLCSSSTH